MLGVAACLLQACNDGKNDSASTPTADSSSDMMNNSTESKEERNKQTVMASMEAMSKGDVEGVLKDADKDVVDYGDGSSSSVKGVDSVKAGLKSWLAAVPDYKGTDMMAVADGDHVMVYGTWSGTWKNALMGMKPTGKSFKIKDVDIFTLNDAGKITEHRSVQSGSVMAQQLGMKMP